MCRYAFDDLYAYYMDDNQKKKLHSRYSYIVTNRAVNHIAFKRKKSFELWLSERGLTVDINKVHTRGQKILGTYQRVLCDWEEFNSLENYKETKVLNNGSYTSGRIVVENGVHVVYLLNPNIRDRPVFDFYKTDAIYG